MLPSSHSPARSFSTVREGQEGQPTLHVWPEPAWHCSLFITQPCLPSALALDVSPSPLCLLWLLLPQTDFVMHLKEDSEKYINSCLDSKKCSQFFATHRAKQIHLLSTTCSILMLTISFLSCVGEHIAETQPC